jgi:hypothetical protein
MFPIKEESMVLYCTDVRLFPNQTLLRRLVGAKTGASGGDPEAAYQRFLGYFRPAAEA